MTLERGFWLFWLGGLLAFAITLFLHLPLAIPEVPAGIGDHQAAGTAAEVDRIQHAWRSAGLWNRAAIAMLSDLLFIVIYGIGAVLGGMWLGRHGGAVRIVGLLVAIAGAVFLITDLTETTAEIVQLWRFQGDDGLAALAAGVRPIKMATWIASFLGIIVGLFLRRFSRRAA